MDGFEVRLQLVSILRKLSSSQNSIQTTIRFLLKHKDRYGVDLWECLIEECEKANLNARMNILYLIDALLFTSSAALLTTFQPKDHHSTTTKAKTNNKEEGSKQEVENDKSPSLTEPSAQPAPLHNNNHVNPANQPSSKKLENSSAPSDLFNYGNLIKRDIKKLIEIVIPLPGNTTNDSNGSKSTNHKKNGLLNLMSTQQIIKNWKSQINLIDRFLNSDELNQIDQILINRKSILAQAEVDPSSGPEHESSDFSKKDILDRIDDDRERHKRLRERIWVLPIPPTATLSPKLATNSQHPASTYTIHRSATLLHTSILSAPSTTMFNSSSSSLLSIDRTISLECDSLISANQEDLGDDGLEESDWQAIKFENTRCFGLPSEAFSLYHQLPPPPPPPPLDY